MRRQHLASWATVILIAVAACNPAASPTAVPATVAPTVQPASSPTLTEKNFEDFIFKNFEDSATITNQWAGLQSGTKFVYEGTTTEDDGTVVSHRIEIHVTDLTKVIGGVRALVTWDLDYSDGELVEAELAFYAQDTLGNIWRMGEYPEEYEEGKLADAPAWIHGLEDARAGIMLQANPQLNTPSYSQGWGPAVDWTDRGQVEQMNQQTCVPVDCYEGVLVIAETSQSEPGAFQLKYYAPNVGNIKVDWKGADATQENLELIRVVQLNAAELVEVRAQAIELEKSAYQTSPEMYGLTSPVEYPPGTPAHMETKAATPVATGSVSPLAEIVIHAVDLPDSALFEMDFYNDPASPGGKLIGLPNTGDELDPPPESDPHVTFTIPVLGSVPYRCWMHIKVGEPFGVSTANVVYVQFTDAVDEAQNEILNVGTGSYLTVEGPEAVGWAWVECDWAESEAEPLVYFKQDGEVTVRLQAGMEGVGFDQFILSSDRFLDKKPTEAIVEKPE